MKQINSPLFIDDEPLIIDMMMSRLGELCAVDISYQTHSDPDIVADMIASGSVFAHDLIVVDRFMFQRDLLTMGLPYLFRDLGYRGHLLIFSYVPVQYELYGYDAYLKKDPQALGDFIPWLFSSKVSTVHSVPSEIQIEKKACPGN